MNRIMFILIFMLTALAGYSQETNWVTYHVEPGSIDSVSKRFVLSEYTLDTSSYETYVKLSEYSNSITSVITILHYNQKLFNSEKRYLDCYIEYYDNRFPEILPHNSSYIKGNKIYIDSKLSNYNNCRITFSGNNIMLYFNL